MIQAEWIAPERTALLLIDMQVDFALPEGKLGQAGTDMRAAQAAVAKAAALADAARHADVPCIFVRLITRPEDETDFTREWKDRRGNDDTPLCREGTRGAQFVGPKPLGGEYVVTKTRYSGFTDTRLDEQLRGLGRDTLVVCGLTTECCVDGTARDAFERDYHVFIVTDAVAAYESDLHEAALKALELNCAGLASTVEICAIWNNIKQ